MPSGFDEDADSARKFSPLPSDVVRRNSRLLHIVHPDGKVSQRVSLQMPDPAAREELICAHYLRNYGVTFADANFGVNILARDRPWDFDLEFSNGERFSLEITAIADGQTQFEADKREERFLLAARKPTIRIRDLRRLAHDFPSEASDLALRAHSGASLDEMVPNPLFNSGEDPHIFLGRVLYPQENLAERVGAAIQQKADKAHGGKEATVLIIDCRANFIDEDMAWADDEKLEALLNSVPFPEVWFYVGYFSGNDGNDAEFSFTPLKLPDDKAQRVLQLAEERGIDQFGRVVWS